MNDLGYVGHKNALCENETVRRLFCFLEERFIILKVTYHYIIENFDLRNYIETPISFLSFGQKKKAFFCKVDYDEN